MKAVQARELLTFSSRQQAGSGLRACFVVEGPAVVEVTGQHEVHGYTPPREARLVVPVGRSLIVVGEEGPRVSGGRLLGCDPASLRPLEEIRGSLSRGRNVVLVGPTDAGKSTLASYLYNSGLAELVASFDVGQNELYCPGFAAAASPSRPLVPGSPDGRSRACLIGDFTPSGVEASYLYCASRLLRGAQNVVVDTDGWVQGEGLVLKADLALQLDATVVALGMSEARRDLLAYVSDVVFLPRLAPRSKSRSERAANRDRLLASCLTGVRRRVVRSDLVVGRPPQGGLEGVLASAVGGGNERFAVVERASEPSGTITVLTDYEGEVEAVRIGRARVDLRAFSGLIGR